VLLLLEETLIRPLLSSQGERLLMPQRARLEEKGYCLPEEAALEERGEKG